MDLGDFAMDLNFGELEDLYSGGFGMGDAFDDASTPNDQQPGCDTSGALKGLNFSEIEMETSQPGDERLGSFDAQGIQATSVAALLNQFENTSAASSRDSIQFHEVTDDSSWMEQKLPAFSLESIRFHDVTEDSTPLRTQSLPASRVCSASASPASTPPGTPPPDILHKIRSSHSQAGKRKATIMLPYAAPHAKRGRGKAAASVTPQTNRCSSKLQRILSRNNNSATLCGVDQSSASAQPAGFQPVKTEGLTADGGQLSQPKVARVSQTAGGKASASTPSPVIISVSSDVRMHRVTDPAVAQSILSKTPRALSLLACPISSQSLATATQPKLCLVQNGTALNSGNAVQILNLKNSSSGFVSLLHTSSSNSRLAVAPQNNKLKSGDQSSSILKGSSTQSQVPSAAQPVNAIEDEPSRKCNIVLSRGAENICGEGLQSVLDHDYCRDSLRRVIVDEFDLDISPTKVCSQKPLQKVQSLPIITTNLSGKLQISNANGVVSHAAEIKSNKQSEPVRALAVSLGTSLGSSNIAVANSSSVVGVPRTLGVSSAASSKITASLCKKKQDVASTLTVSSSAPAATLTAVKKPEVGSTSTVSNPAPFPLALVSVLSKMQNLESLFTLENGTLKLHPSVTASLDPATAASLSQENPQHATAPVTAGNVNAKQKASTVQQKSPGPVAQQPVKKSVLIPGNSSVVGQNGLRKPLQLSAAPTSSLQIVKPLTSQTKISVSKPPTLVNKELQNSKNTFHPSVSTTSVSASTPGVAVCNSNTSAKQGTLCLSTNSSNTKVSACDGTLVQRQKEPFPWQSEGDKSLHPKEEMRDCSGREALCTNSWTNSRASRCDSKETKAPQCSPHVEEDAGNAEASSVMVDYKVVNEKAVPDKTDDMKNEKTAENHKSQILYSMPNFELDGSFNSDLSERVVPPVEPHPHSPAAVQREPSPIPSPSFSHTCDQSAAPHVPLHSPGHSTENNPHPCSPHKGSPEAETAHEPIYHYSDDFAQAWEEEAQLLAERSRVNQDSKTAKYCDEEKTPVADQTAGTSSANSGKSSGHGKKERKWQRSGGGKSWKPGKSPLKKDDSGLFSKIPSYYTALSIPMKTGRKQLTAEAAQSTAFDDSLPADDSSVHPAESTEWYSKLPPYFSCFTNSTKYDRDPTMVKMNGVGDRSGKTADDVTDKTVKSFKSHSSGSSYQPRSSSPARSPERSRWSQASGRSARSYKRRKSNSSSGSSRSGSRRRSWKPRKRRRRRSPSVSGSYHSSSESRSQSSSPSRSRSRSSGSQSRSRSRSRSRRSYRSRSLESHHSSGSRGRNDSVYTNRHMRKQLRKEDKIKKMEERKIVYVGRIPEDYTRRKLYERFQRFGKIEDVSVHFRETGDNYGFVTYYDSMDAFKAIDKGNSLSGELEFELCFGGRRHFCANEYADLDGNRVIEEEYTPVSSKDTMDFDALLRQAQRKMKK